MQSVIFKVNVVYYCSVAKLCLTLCDPVDCSTPGFPGLHYLLKFVQFHIHWWVWATDELVMLSDHLIFCHPLLLLPSIFPNESSLHQSNAPQPPQKNPTRIIVHFPTLVPKVKSEKQTLMHKTNKNAYVWDLEKWYRWTCLQEIETQM